MRGYPKSNSISETEISACNHTSAPKQSKRAVNINAKSGQTCVGEYMTPFQLFGAKAKLSAFVFLVKKRHK
jgi:hypothetical protein